MISRLYTVIRLTALLLTVVAVCSYLYLPEKKLRLYPNVEYPQSLYNGGPEPAENIKWVDEENAEWVCNYADTMDYSCGYSLAMGWETGEGLDLSQFNTINISLNYQGAAPRIRLFLRNYSPKYSKPHAMETTKFMSTVIRREDLSKPIKIQLTEFSVAEWWIFANQVSREMVVPEFGNVVTMGVDFIDRGVHLVKIENIDVIGVWVTRERLYLIIIVIWALALVSEAAVRFRYLKSKSEKESELIEVLVNTYQKMDYKRLEAETLSSTDNLTELLNRTGLNSLVEKLYKDPKQLTDLAIVLFDVDHFKKVNDRRGHDAGDRALKTIANIVSREIRKSDIFARWGGEEFLIITRHTSETDLKEFLEKIRRSIQNHIFEPEDPLFLTVSLGAGFINPMETFDNTFKRVDQALYRAKENGRNCSVITQQ